MPEEVSINPYANRTPENEPPIDYDAAGELCDALVRSGYRFEVREDGTFGAVPVEPQQQEYTEVPHIPHDPSLVRDVADSEGTTVRCVTMMDMYGYTDFYIRSRSPMERLMAQLPLDVLVYQSPKFEDLKYLHPSGVQPFGIKLEDLPRVKPLVEGARHRASHNEAIAKTEAALVLPPGVKRDLLQFFDAVLTRPPKEFKPREPKPAAAVPVPPAPPQNISAVQGDRPAVVLPQPSAAARPTQGPGKPPQGEARTPDDKIRTAFHVASYILAGATGIAGTFSYQDIGNPYVEPMQSRLEVLVTVLLGVAALLSEYVSKIDDPR